MDGSLTFFEKDSHPDYVYDLVKGGEVHRCPRCDKILFVGKLVKGSAIEIWCKRCKTKLIIAVS